jgi:hypothetical protein
MSLKETAKKVEQIIHNKGFKHLYVYSMSDHLVIYSKDGDEKINRSRLSFIQKNNYQLSMADHRGKWEATPYTGTLDELLDLLTNDFAFALIDFNEFS